MQSRLKALETAIKTQAEKVVRGATILNFSGEFTIETVPHFRSCSIPCFLDPRPIVLFPAF